MPGSDDSILCMFPAFPLVNAVRWTASTCAAKGLVQHPPRTPNYLCFPSFHWWDFTHSASTWPAKGIVQHPSDVALSGPAGQGLSMLGSD
jgi:hypothetical protein